MPYVSESARKRLDEQIDALNPLAAGELNYVITRLACNFVLRGVPGGSFRRGPVHELSHLRYDDLNTVVGVLESAKAEFQRRVVAPYEDRKIQENGDVYE